MDGRLLGTVATDQENKSTVASTAKSLFTTTLVAAADASQRGGGAGGSSNPMTDVLYAAGWIVGEFAECVRLVFCTQR